MEMIYRLPTVGSGIHHGAKTIAQTLLFRNCLCDLVQVTDDALVPMREMRERGDVLAGDQKDMHRRLRANVGEDDGVIIFVQLLHGNLARGYFAEQAVHRHQIIPIYLEKNRGCPPGFQGS